VIAGVAVNPVTSVVDYRAHPGSGTTTPAVPTDLPAAQAINPAPTIPAARNDARKQEKATSGTSRDAIIDPRTNAVVFRSLDADTGAVIEQVPAKALLRQRAYTNAQAVQALIKGKDIAAAVLAAAQDVDTTA
jgi:hypothetical protein